MSYKAMKCHGGILNVFYYMKTANEKMLHIRTKLHDILENGKLRRL